MRKNQKQSKSAIVLLSGGLDSATVLYYALKRGYSCRCLLFDYGQRHKKELAAAEKIARGAGCPVQKVRITLPWGGSSLLDKNAVLPHHKKSSRPAALPSTYVPGRNTIFLSFALSYAETTKADALFIGANAVDFSGYPDCRPGYYGAWNALLKQLGVSVRIKSPLVRMTKAQIVRLGVRLGVPYENTWSCYGGGGKPCGNCDSCTYRARGFSEAKIADPAL